jgi:hypothetical protein
MRVHDVRRDTPGQLKDGAPLTQVAPGRNGDGMCCCSAAPQRRDESVIRAGGGKHHRDVHVGTGASLSLRERQDHPLKAADVPGRNDVEDAHTLTQRFLKFRAVSAGWTGALGDVVGVARKQQCGKNGSAPLIALQSARFLPPPCGNDDF